MSRLPDKVTLGRQEINVPVSAADQVVNWFSPVRGAARFAARVRMSALGGGYSGADRKRPANRQTPSIERDADSNILPDLPTLREYSQDALRNSPIAGGAINTNITRIVGTGMKVKPQIDRSVLTHLTKEQADDWEKEARREYLLATETREIDAERQLPFSLYQGLALRKTLEDGDVFINMPRFSRPGSPYKLKLQMIEGARVCNKNFVTDTPEMVAGIGKDKHGAPETVFVLNRHPGNYMYRPLGGDKWEELKMFGAKTGAPQVLQLYDKLRPGQTRGVPYLAPVVELIKQLGRYTDAEVMAAVVTGMLTVFVTNEAGNPEILNQDGYLTDTKNINTEGMELGSGSVLGLVPGEKVETVDPNRPNTAFDPFMMAIMRQIGAQLELPFELLVKHFTASYSAAKAALNEAHAYFTRRRHWLVVNLNQPVYQAVITEAIATGRLAAPGFFTNHKIQKAWLGTMWRGDAFTQLDPVKEIVAAEKRIALRLSTREEETSAMTGQDWEGKVPQMTKERQLLVKNDLLYDDRPEEFASKSETKTETVDDGNGSGSTATDDADKGDLEE